MKNLILLISLLSLPLCFYAQKEKSVTLNKTTKEELQLTVYEKDSTANAVVLYEHANVYVDEKNDYNFRTDHYKRIKIFNNAATDQTTVTIKLYGKRKAEAIKAITYNLQGESIKKTHLLDTQVFENQVSENLKEITFTLPNTSNGCVIEYVYSFITPYLELQDWYFQSDIPKMKSEYTSTIPGNWRYSTRIIGFKKLDKQDSSVKKGCFHVPGVRIDGDCLVSEYGMNDIPAFKEEKYMLAKKNFLSRLAFEIISFTGTDGNTKKYTKKWKDADKTLKNLFLDKQTSKKSYFKNKLPLKLATISDPLEKAKAAYYHIQERMNWNDRYWTSKDLKVKKAYEEKKGSVDAINLILYNSLRALEIESYVVALSTRNNGMPTKLHPVVDDFNYVIVKAIINGETFFLDASDKFLPFGEVPLRCLNGDVRVLDFKEGSYWEAIKPRFKTSLRTQIQLEFNEENQLTGSLIVAKKGHFALNERTALQAKTKDEFLDEFETEHPNIEVENVTTDGLDNNDKSLKSIYKIGLDVTNTEDIIRFNPFIYERMSINPFKLKERNYPVDFGYSRYTTQMTSIKIPEGYTVKSLPKNTGLSLPLKGGSYILKVSNTGNKINLLSRLNITKKIYTSEEYYYLKEFFNQIITSQKSLIVLEKK